MATSVSRAVFSSVFLKDNHPFLQDLQHPYSIILVDAVLEECDKKAFRVDSFHLIYTVNEIFARHESAVSLL